MYQGTRSGRRRGDLFRHDHGRTTGATTSAAASSPSATSRRSASPASARRFSYGWPQGQDDKDIAQPADIEALHRDWKSLSNEGLITSGLAGAACSAPARCARERLPHGVRSGARAWASRSPSTSPSLTTAAERRSRRMPRRICSARTSSSCTPSGPRPTRLKMVKEAGATISISTTSDLRIGFGFPQVSDFLAAGITLGLSVDTSALIGNSEPVRHDAACTMPRTPHLRTSSSCTARRVLELARSRAPARWGSTTRSVR